MANSQHRSLTGASLHEPKGVESAAANRVYLSNGAASGSWTTIPNAALDSSAKAFQAQLLHVRYEVANNTAAGGINNGAWQTRLINTVVTNEISGASLAANQVTLPAGTFYVQATAPSYNATGVNRVRLQNVTDAATLLLGPTVACPAATQVNAEVKGRFTLAAGKTLELQHQVTTTVAVNGAGIQANFGANEVYAEVLIWKVG